jgi:hypothetical protein
MPRNTDLFVRAGSESVRKNLLGAAWPVYKDFEVERTEDDVFIYAPFRPPHLKVGRAYSTEDLLQDQGSEQFYAPLREVPDLFLRFADLARKGSLSADDALQVMLEWATTYGVLGVESLRHWEAPRSDYPRNRRESLASFTGAVREAARCRELYEAATAPDDGTAEIMLEKYQASGNTLRERREWAFIVSGDIVGERLMADCYPLLYRVVENEKAGKAHFWFDKRTVGFEQGWGFHSLLGAMYLQMALYMKEGGEGPRCKRPDCYRLVTFDPPRAAGGQGPNSGSRSKHRTHSNKVFCSGTCRQWWSDNFGNSKKAKRKRERSK